ncbi:hypothetical protein P9112_003393 [Eukaryota sp. TZLM1-RC]
MTRSPQRIQRLQATLERENAKQRVSKFNCKKDSPVKAITKAEYTSEDHLPQLSPRRSPATPSSPATQSLSSPKPKPLPIHDDLANSVLPVIPTSPCKTSQQRLPEPEEDLYAAIAFYNKKVEEKQQNEQKTKKKQCQQLTRKELAAQLQEKQLAAQRQREAELELEMKNLKESEKRSVVDQKRRIRKETCQDQTKIRKDLEAQINDKLDNEAKRKRMRLESELAELQAIKENLKTEEEKKREEVCIKALEYRKQLDLQLKEKRSQTENENDSNNEDSFVERFHAAHEQSISKQRQTIEKWKSTQSVIAPIYEEKVQESAQQRLCKWAQMSVEHRRKVIELVKERERKAKLEKVKKQREVIETLNKQKKEHEQLVKAELDDHLEYAKNVELQAKMAEELEKQRQLKKKKEMLECKKALDQQVLEKKQRKEGVSQAEIDLNKKLVNSIKSCI